jgi:hypothetical protein
VHHYRLGQHLAAIPLEHFVDVAGDGSHAIMLSISGHDMVHTPHDGMLYVAERDGDQVIAYHLDLVGSPPSLEFQGRYLPIHSWGSRSLVVNGGHVFYDVPRLELGKDSVVRWVRLQEIPNERYSTTATLRSRHTLENGRLDSQLDGRQRDCVWHRLFLDACIPEAAKVEVWARASNDPRSLDGISFNQQPDLYLRRSGSEIPYHVPFSADAPSGSGTWELLFQDVRARFLQLQLVLIGNGRVTPQLRSLRVYYPRFSYSQRYLPGASVFRPAHGASGSTGLARQLDWFASRSSLGRRPAPPRLMLEAGRDECRSKTAVHSLCSQALSAAGHDRRNSPGPSLIA